MEQVYRTAEVVNSYFKTQCRNVYAGGIAGIFYKVMLVVAGQHDVLT